VQIKGEEKKKGPKACVLNLDGDKMGITELGEIIIFSLLEDMKREGGFGEAALHQKKGEKRK
jgi:hypothetical protein